jgi:predicted transposase YdaD
MTLTAFKYDKSSYLKAEIITHYVSIITIRIPQNSRLFSGFISKEERENIRNEKLQIARKMQAAGISAAQIQEFTGFSPEDIPQA